MRCYQRLFLLFIIPLAICLGVAIIIYVNCRSVVKYPVPRIEPENYILNTTQMLDINN